MSKTRRNHSAVFKAYDTVHEARSSLAKYFVL